MKLFEGKSAVAMAGVMLGAVLASGPVQAQAQAPQAPGKLDMTQVEDWQVRCSPAPSPSPCDMFQEMANKDRNQRILAISVAYVPSVDRYALTIAVPLGISIPKGVSLQSDSYTTPTFHYRRCDRDGCYVEAPVDKSVIEGLARSSADGKAGANIVVDNGKAYRLTFSLKGFSAAHDDMVSKARAKAKPVSQAGAPGAPQQ
jgi:invasion protein IalB